MRTTRRDTVVRSRLYRRPLDLAVTCIEDSLVSSQRFGYIGEGQGQASDLQLKTFSLSQIRRQREPEMVTITFSDREAEKRALGFLIGRFSGRILRSGEHLVPEAALEALAEQNISFTVRGKATYCPTCR
jgi:hypothetical protein